MRDQVPQRRTTSRRGVAAASGALVMVLGVSATGGTGSSAGLAATGGSPASVVLTSTGAPLQPEIAQILAQMQTAQAADGKLPWATSDNSTLLEGLLQQTNFRNLMLALHPLSASNHIDHYPEVMAGDAADSRAYGGFDNPDVFYNTVTLAPGASYVVHGTVGRGDEDVVFSTFGATASGTVPFGTLELDHGLVVNPDGTYTVDIGPTEPSGAVNYIGDSTGATFPGVIDVTVRNVMGNQALGPGTLSIDCVSDCPAATPGVTDTGLSSAAISSLLNTLAREVPGTNERAMSLAVTGGITQPANTMTPLTTEAETGEIGGDQTEVVSAGNFDLQSGQALIVKVPQVDAAYSGIQLNNVWGQTVPYPLTGASLNNTQAFADPNGYTYYVVSATNPGVANWLDTGGIEHGEVMTRSYDLAPGANPGGLPVTTEVVPVADVSKYLPADTPTVTPAEYAATMTERVLAYDYSLDSTRAFSSGWVTDELWMHDLQAAMGSNGFDEVFGVQPSTDMWLRLTPALSPDMFTVLKDLLADPSAAMTAVQDNLALAEKDISLPIQLAEALLQKDPGSFLSVVNEALFDPNTSITAGLLNARDDLATAIMAATKDGFASQAGPLATWEWQHMSELTQLNPSSALTDLGSLLSPADLLGS